MKSDAIFFGTHPDDVEICCGGTLIKLIRNRKKAGIIDLTLGELSSSGNLKIREKETNEANKALGVTFRENLKLPDGAIENSPENRNNIITAIRKYKPTVIFVPYFKDRHPDHENASLLIKSAAFYSGLGKIITRYNNRKQTPHKPKKIIYYMHHYTFKPSFIINISGEFEIKMKSIKCYKSQFLRSGKNPSTFINDKKFLNYIEAKASFYGFQIGVRYGEPFFVEDNLNLNISSIFNI